MPDRVDFVFNLNNDSLAVGRWQELRNDLGLTKALSKTWPCIVTDPASDARTYTPDVMDDLENETFVLLYRFGDVAIAVQLGHGHVHARAAGTSIEDCAAALELLQESLPEHGLTDDGKIPVTFWAYTPNGPMSQVRDLRVPAWDEIAWNYGERERSEVERLVSPDFVPGQGGQLLLWRGIPGTGKTTALRALGHSWRDWARIHYITDPEHFFGDHADYMLQVMLGAGDIEGKDKDGKWRLLVLEDAGELLRKDSKEKVGQALSRFLNAVDGMIGQGLRFLTLVTTNEEDLGALNDAVSRHGRAAANTEFKKLTPQEAAQVLYNLRNGDDEPGFAISDAEDLVDFKHMALADVYALAEGRQDDLPEKQAVGFTSG
jgi:hypothetical protein